MKKILYDLHEFYMFEANTIKEDKIKDELKNNKKYSDNEYALLWIKRNAKKFEKQYRKKYGIILEEK